MRCAYLLWPAEARCRPDAACHAAHLPLSDRSGYGWLRGRRPFLFEGRRSRRRPVPVWRAEGQRGPGDLLLRAMAQPPISGVDWFREAGCSGGAELRVVGRLGQPSGYRLGLKNVLLELEVAELDRGAGQAHQASCARPDSCYADQDPVICGRCPARSTPSSSSTRPDRSRTGPRAASRASLACRSQAT